MASPATVSRCGMVYMTFEELGWRPFVRTWLYTFFDDEILSDNLREFIYSNFDATIDIGLEKIRDTLTEPIKTVDLQQVVSICNFLEVYLNVNMGFKGTDDEKKKLDGAKNALESFVYAIREKRDAEEESIALVTSEEQRESLGNVLMEIEEWLYGDGASADYATYKNKLAESKASVDPIFVRVEELKARPQLLENTKSTIDAWYEMIAAWNRTHPQVSLYFI